ncbi:MAG: RNA 2',3'-cyclic phosphodiesterase [Firmicutes bacterium HGW-Firmicutes-8]|nr:MAG: RNA 2',3'-cyclic phosphodiesterase [Firmicutes bacterium HGW-Firmicutes-8]
MDTYRCFVAIDLPAGLKKELADIQRGLAGWPAKVKWVEERNFHLTLKFLGDITHSQVEVIAEGLKIVTARHKKFTFVISGLGAFPSIRNAKVIWAGIRDTGGGLTRLRSDIEAVLGGQGFAPETKPFSPHLTLGRVKDLKPVPGLPEIMQSLVLEDCPASVPEIKLMSSKLSKSGPEYSCLRLFILQEHF